MSKVETYAPPKGGFSFDLCRRNEMLSMKGVQSPSFLKTGTTIVGVIFQDGVILGADTRATEGPIVADKNCEKIHYMAPNTYCCGAGTAADTEAVTDMISSKLKLHRDHTGQGSRVVTALTLSKSHLFRFTLMDQPTLLPFATMGSGSLAAVAIFESEYCEGLNGQKEYLKNYLVPNPRTYVSSKGDIHFPQRLVLLTKITPLKEMVLVIEGEDAMEE